MPTNSFVKLPQNAAGHQGIMTEFNKGTSTKYLDETIWRHRCESVIPQISDQSWFNKLDDINCQNELLYKLQPTGIVINSMDSYNQELKSATPRQTTQKMQFGEWVYSQNKFSKMELASMCDRNSYMSDLEEEFRRQYDDYIERLAFSRMVCVSPCWNKDACEQVKTGSPTAPLDIHVGNSHLLPLSLDELNKSMCDEQGYFLTWPKCETSVLSQNKEVIANERNCCDSENTHQMMNKIPK
ncbi:MAG TPA: hypothetical protein EYP39_01455, partial [Ghiorsea sp.]|nr:hypothetical protein [Ghiorsea sp.]